MVKLNSVWNHWLDILHKFQSTSVFFYMAIIWYWIVPISSLNRNLTPKIVKKSTQKLSAGKLLFFFLLGTYYQLPYLGNYQINLKAVLLPAL